MRVSVLPLRNQTGRYARNNVPRGQRKCLCRNFNLNREYELHVERICYIPRYVPDRQSMFKC